MLIFFGFLRPDMSVWRYRNRCFLLTLCHMIVMRPNSKQQRRNSSFSRWKYFGVVLVAFCMWKCVSEAIFSGVDILSFLCVACYNRWVFRQGHKNYFKDKCFIHPQPLPSILTSIFISVKWLLLKFSFNQHSRSLF